VAAPQAGADTSAAPPRREGEHDHRGSRRGRRGGRRRGSREQGPRGARGDNGAGTEGSTPRGAADSGEPHTTSASPEPRQESVFTPAEQPPRPVTVSHNVEPPAAPEPQDPKD
jgi:hypothetical protein